MNSHVTSPHPYFVNLCHSFFPLLNGFHFLPVFFEELFEVVRRAFVDDDATDELEDCEDNEDVDPTRDNLLGAEVSLEGGSGGEASPSCGGGVIDFADGVSGGDGGAGGAPEDLGGGGACSDCSGAAEPRGVDIGSPRCFRNLRSNHPLSLSTTASM